MGSISKLSTLVLFTVVATGCGGGASFPKTYPVTGKVTVGGKAIEGAMVTFQLDSGKENAIGTTDKNGEFSLSMFQPGDGAVPGQYRIAVSKLPPGATTAADTPPPGQIASAELPSDYAPPADTSKASGSTGPKSEVPAKYSNDKTSGLRATIVAGPNNVPLELKP